MKNKITVQKVLRNCEEQGSEQLQNKELCLEISFTISNILKENENEVWLF